MKKIRAFTLLFLLIISSSCLAFALPARDENSTPRFNFDLNVDGDLNSGLGVLLDAVKPGVIYHGVVTLHNPEDVIAQYAVQTTNGVVSPRGDYVFAPIGSSSGLGNWVKFDKTNLELGPGASEMIPFTVDVPEDAEPGDYISELTMILTGYGNPAEVDEAVAENTASAKATATVAMGTSMLFHVLGDVNYEVLVENAGWNFEAGQGYFVNVSIANKSSVSVRPLLNVVVNDNSDKELYNKDFTYTSPLFPGVTSGQSFALTDLKELPYGRYKVAISVYYISEYEYFALANSGDPVSRDLMKLSGEADFSVWILPLTIIYITVGIFLFLIILFIFWNYYRRKRDANN